MKSIKEAWATVSADTRSALKSALRLIEAAALLIVAYYNYTTAYQAHLSGFEFNVRVIASVVIGLRGSYEFLRYLAQKDK